MRKDKYDHLVFKGLFGKELSEDRINKRRRCDPVLANETEEELASLEQQKELLGPVMSKYAGVLQRDLKRMGCHYAYCFTHLDKLITVGVWNGEVMYQIDGHEVYSIGEDFDLDNAIGVSNTRCSRVHQMKNALGNYEYHTQYLLKEANDYGMSLQDVMDWDGEMSDLEKRLGEELSGHPEFSHDEEYGEDPVLTIV